MRIRTLLLLALGSGCTGQPSLAGTGPAKLQARSNDPASPARVEPELPREQAMQSAPQAVAEWSAPPEVFVERASVALGDLVDALSDVAASMQRSAAVRSDFAAFRATYGLPDDMALFGDYVRVKLAFEATRDGGLWHLRWKITDRAPNSEVIWQQWSTLQVGEAASEVGVTAEAECDELSALFAVLARRLGVEQIGLFWPRWNHVVAVWTVRDTAGDARRIIVPTSQVFLARGESLGTRGFDATTQKNIYTYRRPDVSDDYQLPGALARFFVQQAWRYAGRPQSELQRLRNQRSARFGGS